MLLCVPRHQIHGMHNVWINASSAPSILHVRNELTLLTCVRIKGFALFSFLFSYFFFAVDQSKERNREMKIKIKKTHSSYPSLFTPAAMCFFSLLRSQPTKHRADTVVLQRRTEMAFGGREKCGGDSLQGGQRPHWWVSRWTELWRGRAL